jgi:hypothetical protein
MFAFVYKHVCVCVCVCVWCVWRQLIWRQSFGYVNPPLTAWEIKNKYGNTRVCFRKLIIGIYGPASPFCIMATVSLSLFLSLFLFLSRARSLSLLSFSLARSRARARALSLSLSHTHIHTFFSASPIFTRTHRVGGARRTRNASARH